MLEHDAALGARALDRRPPKETAPEVGFRKPAMRFSSVVLPQPEAPSATTNLARFDRQRNVIERDHAPSLVVAVVSHDDVAHFEDGFMRRLPAFPGEIRRTSPSTYWVGVDGAP